MAKHVHEIMNREVFMLRPDETAEEALSSLSALDIGGAPVVDASRRPLGAVAWRDLVDHREERVRDHMTSPAIVVGPNDTIAHAADVIAEHGIHRVFVIDGHGVLVGAVSALDVLRALTGHAVHHPPAFPHLEGGITWTDEEPFELAAFDAAPRGPGVLVLIESVPAEPDDVALVESANDVRARLIELASIPPSDRPSLERLLAHPSRLRFRAAAIGDPRRREALANKLRRRATRQLRAQVLR